MVRGQCHTLEMTLDEVAIIVGQMLPGAVRAQMAAQCRHDERLSLGGGYAADQSGRRRLILQHSLGDVIAVAGAALVGVSWAHAVAAIVEQAPAQQRGRAPQPAAPRARPGRKLGLHRREQRTIHNRRLFAAMDLAPVDHLADIEAVLEQMGERPHAKAPPPMVRPFDSRRGLLRIPRRSRSCASARTEPSSRYRAKIVRTAAASAATTTIFLSTAA